MDTTFTNNINTIICISSLYTIYSMYYVIHPRTFWTCTYQSQVAHKKKIVQYKNNRNWKAVKKIAGKIKIAYPWFSNQFKYQNWTANIFTFFLLEYKINIANKLIQISWINWIKWMNEWMEKNGFLCMYMDGYYVSVN